MAAYLTTPLALNCARKLSERASFCSALPNTVGTTRRCPSAVSAMIMGDTSPVFLNALHAKSAACSARASNGSIEGSFGDIGIWYQDRESRYTRSIIWNGHHLV